MIDMKTQKQIQKLYEYHLTELRKLKGKGCAWEKKRHESEIELLAWVLG